MVRILLAQHCVAGLISHELTTGDSVKRTIDLSQYNLDIKSITMRTVNSQDMLEAAARCVPPDGGDINAYIFQLMHRSQMTIQAIEAVDGKPVVGIHVQADRWSLQTMEFVREIYDFMNGVESDVRESFRKGLAAAPASTTQPPT